MSVWKIILDGEDTPLYAPPIDRAEQGIIDPILTMTVSVAGSLEFGMPPGHKLYNKIRPIASVVTVERDGKWMWSGRVDRIDKNFQGVKTVYCVGLLSLLNDIQLEPYTYVTDEVKWLLNYYIAKYNGRVSAPWKLHLGRVDGFADIARVKAVSGEWSSIWEAITDNLLEPYGGFLRVRRDSGVNYIDYTDSYEIAEQPIEYAKNLLDFAETQDGSDFFTVAVPVGKANSDGVQCTIRSIANPAHQSIPSYPYGLIYGNYPDRYGYIEKLVNFDTVQSPYGLIDAARRALIENDIPITRTYKAVDLCDAGINTDHLECGKLFHSVSAPHNVDEWAACTQAVIYIQRPERNQYTVGSTSKEMTAQLALEWNAERRSDRRILNTLTRPDTSELDEINRSFESIQFRGGASYAENTIWTVNESLYNDFNGIDVSLRKTSDGKYILLHDATVDRVTTGSGAISSMTLAQALSLPTVSPDYYGGTGHLCSYDALCDWLHEVECVAYVKLPEDVAWTEFDIRKIIRTAASRGALNRLRLYGNDSVYNHLLTAVSTINGYHGSKAQVGFWNDPTLGGNAERVRALKELASTGGAAVYLRVNGNYITPEDWPALEALDVPVVAYITNVGAPAEADRVLDLYQRYGITRFVTQYTHAGKEIAKNEHIL